MNEQEVMSTLMLNKGALALALGALAYLRWWASECRCEKCGFHVNEARMKRAREADKDHSDTHRSWGKCGNPDCPDNPREVD